MKGKFIFILFLFLPVFLLSQGPGGFCLTFDGVDDYVSITNDTTINMGDPIQTRTIEAYFNVDDATSTTYQTIYEEGGMLRGLNIYVYAGRVYVYGWNNDSSQSGWTNGTWHSAAITSGTWHHIALVLDGPADDTIIANAFTGYLDGVSIGSGDGSRIWAHSGGIGIGATNHQTKFHNYDFSGDGYFFAGQIDEFRIWNVARTPEQISNNMHNELTDPGIDTDLIAYWNFNENTGVILNDISPNGNNGALTGSIDGPPVWEDSDAPLPVTLTAFTAIQTLDNHVKLSWTVESESEMYGYYLYRAIADTENLESISNIITADNTPFSHSYEFVDYESTPGNVYDYYLESITLDGSSNMQDPIRFTHDFDDYEENPAIPNELSNLSNYPNPFNPSTTIQFSVNENQNNGTVIIDIYNTKGQKVKSLVNENISAGNHSVVWNGLDKNGKKVNSGIYYSKLIINNKIIESNKMVLIK